jgi:hypothetical protein
MRRVERGHVQVDEPLSLRFGDPEVSVNVDQVGEAKLSGEAVRTAEGLDGEGSQVIDVLGLSLSKERLKQGISEDAAVEDVFEAMNRLFATCEFVE